MCDNETVLIQYKERKMVGGGGGGRRDNEWNGRKGIIGYTYRKTELVI